MERIVRRIAGFILLGLFVLIEVTESIKVLRELIPEWLMGYVNQPTAVVICLVGILFLFLGYKAEKEPAPPPVVPPSAPTPISNEVSPTISPVISPTFNPTIEVNNYLHPQPPEEEFKKVPPSPAQIEHPHNVQFIRAQRHRSPTYEPARFVALFENVPIPNQAPKRFSDVKAKIEYKNYQSRKTIMTIYPGAWADRQDLNVYMGVGEPFYLTLAVFADNQWNAAEATMQGAGWGEMIYQEEYHPLPVGDFLLTVTLVGDHGLSIQPEDFHLQILANGAVNIRHLSPGTQS